jgi:hypothetical protein
LLALFQRTSADLVSTSSGDVESEDRIDENKGDRNNEKPKALGVRREGKNALNC